MPANIKPQVPGSGIGGGTIGTPKVPEAELASVTPAGSSRRSVAVLSSAPVTVEPASTPKMLKFSRAPRSISTLAPETVRVTLKVSAIEPKP
jgi:hypothetical protein